MSHLYVLARSSRFRWGVNGLSQQKLSSRQESTIEKGQPCFKLLLLSFILWIKNQTSVHLPNFTDIWLWKWTIMQKITLLKTFLRSIYKPNWSTRSCYINHQKLILNLFSLLKYGIDVLDYTYFETKILKIDKFITD